MTYLKDINIFGYIDSRGDIAKVSKLGFSNQIVKNIFNSKNGDSRLSDEKNINNIDNYKFNKSFAANIATNTSLVARVKNKLNQIQDLSLTPTQSGKTITFDVAYTILDPISKNLQTSTFKFTIDK